MESERGSLTVTAAALNYLSRMTDAIFATQMERAAQKIAERERYFHRRDV